MSEQGRNGQEKTHNFRVQPCSIRTLDDGIVKIIRVTLALVLQFVEEVEDVESEHC